MTVPPYVVAPIVAGGAAAIGWLATRGGSEAADDTEHGWKCTECGHRHASNPGTCGNCGWTVFDWDPGPPGPGDQRADRSGESVSTAVVSEVAEHEGTRPERLDPLYENIDTDALDALVRNMESGTITFEYHGHEVTVTPDGTVFVDGGDDAASAAVAGGP